MTTTSTTTTTSDPTAPVAVQGTTAYGVATDVVKLGIIAASLIFHKSLDISGAPEAAIVSTLSAIIGAKYMSHVWNWGKPVVRAVETKVESVESAIKNPAVASEIADLQAKLDALTAKNQGATS